MKLTSAERQLLAQATGADLPVDCMGWGADGQHLIDLGYARYKEKPGTRSGHFCITPAGRAALNDGESDV